MSMYTGSTKDEALINATMATCKPCCYGGGDSGTCVGKPCCGDCPFFFVPTGGTPAFPPLFADIYIEDLGSFTVQLDFVPGLTNCPVAIEGNPAQNGAIFAYVGGYTTLYDEPADFGAIDCKTGVGVFIETTHEYEVTVVLTCGNPYAAGEPVVPLAGFGKCTAFKLEIGVTHYTAGTIKNATITAYENNTVPAVLSVCSGVNKLTLESCDPVLFTTSSESPILCYDDPAVCNSTAYTNMVGKTWHVEINQ